MRPLSYFENRSWKDEATGCWNWTLYAYPNGYGGFTDPAVKRTLSTHRGAWIAANGPIPEGKVVCHRCDNKLCCNPDHLFLGTHGISQPSVSSIGLKKTWRHVQAVTT